MGETKLEMLDKTLTELDILLSHHKLIEIGLFLLIFSFSLFFLTRGWKVVWDFIKGLVENKLGIKLSGDKEESSIFEQENNDITMEELMITVDEIDSKVNIMKEEINRLLNNLEKIQSLSKDYEISSHNLIQKCEQLHTELNHIKEISEKNHSNISDKIENFEKLIEGNFKLIGKDIENIQKDLNSVESEIKKLKDILMMKGYIKKDDESRL